MYIERKEEGLSGPARIGRVSFSKTGRTLYYDGRSFRRCVGYKYNCREEGTDARYWISGPRRDGRDRLYQEAKPVEIDDDARVEYWTAIRRSPERAHERVANR